MSAVVLVTGTDTDVGKTFIACRILERLRREGFAVSAFKPAASGAVDERWPDVDALRSASGRDDVCPQMFAAPLAPPDAARAESREIDTHAIEEGLRAAALPDTYLVVEGVGGLHCPLTDSQTVGEWAVRYELPLIVVVALRLGAINHALLTAEFADSLGLPTKFILNESQPCDPAVRSSTVRALASRLGDRIIAEVRPGGELLRFESDRPTMKATEPVALSSLTDCFGTFR